MITGYNTDIRYKERVFHVQTEDRGLKNPVLETVVYFGGQVLAAKRSTYSDLIDEGKGVEEISSRMDHQHRMMIAAIRAGKLDPKMIEVGIVTAAEEAPAEGKANLLEAAKDDSGPTLDQVILDYLTTEAQQDSLELVLDGGDDLKQGTKRKLRLVATSGKTGLPVSGARVNVKMISTVKDPQSLAEGATDDDGALELEVAIPSLSSGVGAVIVSATSVIGGAELKYLL